jgi:hypothetical protein
MHYPPFGIESSSLWSYYNDVLKRKGRGVKDLEDLGLQSAADLCRLGALSATYTHPVGGWGTPSFLRGYGPYRVPGCVYITSFLTQRMGDRIRIWNKRGHPPNCHTYEARVCHILHAPVEVLRSYGMVDHRCAPTWWTWKARHLEGVVGKPVRV